MKRGMRRAALGLGAMLFMLGTGVCILGHEALRVIISFGVEEEKARQGAMMALGAGVVLAAFGAGLFAAAAPGTRA